MWVDPMLLAMNWGAALLMALGLGIVYWHATRDTGAPSLWPLALALCTGMQPETQVSSPHQCKPCGLRTSWLVCVSQCMCGARSVRMCGARSVRMCGTVSVRMCGARSVRMCGTMSVRMCGAA